MKSPRPVNLVRALRHQQTDAESIIWSRLRDRRFEGAKFRRQHPVDNFIVDFVSLSSRLIIEIDGGQHNDLPEIEKDLERTKRLEAKGYQVIRFWDSDVFENLDGVLEKIQEALTNRSHPHLNPLPHRERGR